MRLVDEDIPKPRLTLVHTDHRLVRLCHRVTLHPSLDVVVSSEFETLCELFHISNS